MICKGVVIGGSFVRTKVNVIEDLNGNKIVFIQDIIFKGKR
jgi:hypothetical protein